MKILLTGATSYLGEHVMRALCDRGDSVIVIQRQLSKVAEELDCHQYLCDLANISSTTEKFLVDVLSDVDAVIHLAAKVGVVGTYKEFYDVNVIGTQNILRIARKADVDKFVYISSPSVAHIGSALVGETTTQADPEKARGYYSQTKAEAELIVLNSDSPTFHTIAVRPHLVWGPGDTQLVGRVAKKAKKNKLTVINHGTALIDTTYIDNAVSAIVAAVDNIGTAHGKAYVVSNGQPRTVKEMFERICQATMVDTHIRSVPLSLAYPLGGICELAWKVTEKREDPPITRFLAVQLGTAHWFSLAQTREKLNWTPEVSLETGFNNLYRWTVQQKIK